MDYIARQMPDDWSNFEQVNKDTNLEIELLKKEVGQCFPFYDMKYDFRTAAFFCRIDEETLEEKFDSLRRSLSDKGYIPMLRYVKGEHIIYVIRKSKKKGKPVWVNISLLIATIITTSLTGSILYMGYNDIWNIPRIMDVFMPENLFNGILLFAFPLMSILFVHEMGHYFISKKHGIATSLPFFIPIPPIMPSFNIGTFGALISSRDPMPNRKALFDVGISGPLAGFIVAISVTIIGLMLSQPVPMIEPAAGEVVLGQSTLFTLLAGFILQIPINFSWSITGIITLAEPVQLSLIAFAGWVGLLITSINLLPAGQLDGGHIFRAFLGEKQKWAGWIAVMIMIFTGWFFFAIIIMFMMGMQHPPPLNDATPLDMKRKLLFFIAIVILIVCYIPYPINIV